MELYGWLYRGTRKVQWSAGTSRMTMNITNISPREKLYQSKCLFRLHIICTLISDTPTTTGQLSRGCVCVCDVASYHRLFGLLWYHHCCVYVLSVLHPYVYFGFVSMACHHSYISWILVFVSLSAACLLYICCIVCTWALSSFNKTLKLRDITSATTDTTLATRTETYSRWQLYTELWVSSTSPLETGSLMSNALNSISLPMRSLGTINNGQSSSAHAETPLTEESRTFCLRTVQLKSVSRTFVPSWPLIFNLNRQKSSNAFASIPDPGRLTRRSPPTLHS